MINDQEDHLCGDLVGEPIDRSTQGPDRPAVADPGTAAAHGQTAGPALRKVGKGNRALARGLHLASVNDLVQTAGARAGLNP